MGVTRKVEVIIARRGGFCMISLRGGVKSVLGTGQRVKRANPGRPFHLKERWRG